MPIYPQFLDLPAAPAQVDDLDLDSLDDDLLNEVDPPPASISKHIKHHIPRERPREASWQTSWLR